MSEIGPVSWLVNDDELTEYYRYGRLVDDNRESLGYHE